MTTEKCLGLRQIGLVDLERPRQLCDEEAILV